MTSSKRRVTSAVYVGCLIATVLVCFLPHFKAQELVILILIIIQFLALCWYSLSYIPFGHRMARGAARQVSSNFALG
eukprot:CAMPEP_0204278878 /NCGR_PEP_ID=MMETSP0468-20130131/33114_1 /ASSEMBLY_ACC=CAM_ASM_000383 /TAXON_ID=2969 /ORGANISM="Oxyrrhis marina" /LENGTH=76 /DNA_ID=CAMNT_0051255879 /DNA_START=238 /DNA_END=468 /DNA_ORIENTATION=+